MNKKLLLKLMDSGLLKLNQPSTISGIVTVLCAITFLKVHNEFIQTTAAIITLIAGLYSWVRNEIIKNDTK